MASRTVRFQVGGCHALPFSPIVTVQGGGAGRTGSYAHPGLHVQIRQPSAQAHLTRANVVLPRTFNVDLGAPALRAACSREAYARDACPAAATVGSVRAVTPVFAEPLTGPAFLRQKQGRLPDLVLRLANAHYRIDVVAVLDFLADGRVIARTGGIPDAPIERVDIAIRGGAGSTLLARSDLCAKPLATQATLRGHNGKRSVKTPTTRILGCGPAGPGTVR